MADLISTLKAQHEAVGKLAIDIDAAVKERNPGRIQALLGEFKRALLAHLALEDSQLYPALRSAKGAQSADQIARTVKIFTDNVAMISRSLSGFLERYENKPIDLARFTPEWTNILNVLSMRIQSEESTLYPLFQKWVGAAAA